MSTRIAGIAVVVLALTATLAAQSPLPPPELTEEGIVNAASFQAGEVAPGALISIFGTNLGLQMVGGATTTISELATEIPLGTSLGGHSIVFSNGSSEVEAPLIFVSGPANQINAQVPWEVAGQANVQMLVRVDDGAEGMTESEPVSVDVSAAGISPAFFTLDFGPGRAVAVNVKVSAEDDVINGSLAQPGGQPAPQGGYLILYANGLGPVDPPGVTGNASLDALRTAVQTPVVTVGADNLPVNVQFAGLAPEFVGVYQINAILPENVPPGDQVPIRMSVGGVQSRNDVTIAVRARP